MPARNPAAKLMGLLLMALLGAAGAGADPATYAELDLKDGQVLHNVTIVAFGSSTVMAKWDGGRGTIRIDNLPDGIVPAANRAKAPSPTPPPRASAPAAAPPEDYPPGMVPAPGANFQTPWQTETQYIVETIASDLTEMAYYAKHREPRRDKGLAATAAMAPAPGFASRVNFLVKANVGEDGEVVVVLPLDGPIWAPETFRPLTAALFAALGLPAGTADAGEPLETVHSLLEPTVEHLVFADEQVSTRLAAAFTSPEVHEQAAFLLSVFEMRESAGKFHQAKFELCRMTAHLAFAEALRHGKPPTPAGQIATALLTVLYNNQATAANLANALPADSDSAAWQRVVRMRATGDYRIFTETPAHTLAERLERLRSYARVGSERAWEEVHLTNEEVVQADWWRLISDVGHSVQMGHRILDARLAAELRECKVAYEAESGSSFATAGIGALNAEPQHCVFAGEGGAAQVKVIGWGTWAGFLQRELCAAVAEDFDFIERRWSVPAEAADFRKAVDDRFWELRLYPLVRRQDSTQKDYYHRAQDDEMALVHRSPQVVPAAAWNDISYAPRGLERYVPPPHPFINEWHLPNPPPGTAYDIEPRFNHPSMTTVPDYAGLLEHLHAIAPYDTTIAYKLIYERYSMYPPAERVQEIYGRMVEYHASPCIWIAQLSVNTPGAFEKWMRRGIAIAPSNEVDLACYFASRGREPEAEASYEKWLAAEKDDVRVANSVEWLVEYRERKGDDAGAMDLAKRASDTGSGRGMGTMAHLLENRKFYDAAYKVYSDIHERYNDTAPIIGFLWRMRQIGSPARKDSLLDNLIRERLPQGLLPAPPDPGAAPPRSGAKVESPDDVPVVTGLKWKDVIVAANGFQVSGPAAFEIVKSLDPKARLAMTIWRDNHYVKLPECAGDYIPVTPALSDYKP